MSTAELLLGTEVLKPEHPSVPQPAKQNQESCGRTSDPRVSPMLKPIVPAFPKTQQGVVSHAVQGTEGG